MLKFILLMLSSFVSMVAAAHTVSFIFNGSLLLAVATFVFFCAGCYMTVALTSVQEA